MKNIINALTANIFSISLKKLMARAASVVAATVALSLPASATIPVTDYDIYTGDLNGDGSSDIYLMPPVIWILIGSDIAVPIPIMGQGIVLYLSGASYTTPQPLQLDYSRLSRLTKYKANTDYIWWTNQRKSSLLIRALGATDPALTLHLDAYNNFVLGQTIPVDSRASINNRSLSLTVTDVNSDGQADLVLGGYTYLANSTGALSTQLLSVAEQLPTHYFIAKRFDSAGRLLGTIASDSDDAGPLGYPAIRNTYDATTGLLIKVEKGQLAQWQSNAIEPKNWSEFTVHTIQMTAYDGAGRQSTVKKFGANTTTPLSVTQYSYDIYSRISCSAVRMNVANFANLPDVADACALTLEGASGPDRISRYSYENSFGNIVTQESAVGTPLAQTYVTNTYVVGTALLESQTDANGNRTDYFYDANKRLRKVQYPITEKNAGVSNPNDYVEFDYDVDGNKKYERKRSGAQINYTYDNNNRLAVKDYVSNVNQRDVYYQYDNRGLQLAATFDSTSGVGITHIYDGFGSLAKASNNLSGLTQVLSYTYDLNGNRTSLTHPDGETVYYTFDQRNRINNLTAPDAFLNVKYQANGRRQSITRSNGAVTHYTFADNVRLTEFKQDFTGTADDLVNQFRAFNPANQITELNIGNMQYYYQGNDNRVGTYGADGLNRYTKINGQPLGYDGNSNLINDGSSIYSYDDENRLIGASNPSTATTATLKYDPNGRLYVATINGVSTQFLYDGDTLIAEYNSSGALTNRYVHGDQVDEPLIQYNGSAANASSARFLHVDHQGSVIAHSDLNGSVPNKLSYDVYGIPNANNLGRFAYTGQTYFKELGIYYYKARFYSPKIGRFLQTDPIGYDDDINLYAYVGNDPVNMVDPTGEAGKSAWLINLGASATRKVARITQQQAVNIRQSGGNVLADSRQIAKQIETAAHGKDNLLKHRGHELPDGSVGKPHFQTDGSKGHTFWGVVTATLLGAADLLDKAAYAADLIEGGPIERMSDDLRAQLKQNAANQIDKLKSKEQSNDSENEGASFYRMSNTTDKMCLNINRNGC